MLIHELPWELPWNESSGLPFRRFMIPFRFYTIIPGGVAALVLAYFVFRQKHTNPTELETQRRLWLEKVGRITDGTVIDVQEQKTAERPATLLIYHYDVAGVSYEASQDVTYLRQRINLHSCRLGLPTSVRYDPQNPGNSLVISEKWIGLRQ